MDEPWTGWAGDLISIMKDVKNHLSVHVGDNPQIPADAFLGTKPYAFNYSDICTDADAIKISNMIKNTNKDQTLSQILTDYYENYCQNRISYYLPDIGTNHVSVCDIYEKLSDYMSEIPQQAATIFLNGTIISEEIQKACWKSFAKYIYAALTS